MARIRSVHPGFFTDEDLVSVSMGARLLVIGLGIDADDKGIFEWKPLTIKMKVFPADNVDVPALLSELEAAKAIKRFEHDGRSYGAIRNFRKFQRPKTPNDIHPMPDEIRNYVGLQEQISEAFPQQFGNASENSRQMEDGGDKGIGSEPKGSSHVAPEELLEGKKAAAGACLKTAFPEPKKHMIPKDWKAPPRSELPPRARACADQWTDASYETEGEAFACYWRSERKMKADWRDTWANRVVARHSAVMRDQKFGNAAPPIAKELTASQWREWAERYARQGNRDHAEACRQKAIALEQRVT